MSSLKPFLTGRRAVAAPGVYDAFSARVAEQVGHEALYLGGNAMALGLGKGQPFLTLTETAGILARVAGVVKAPLLVDAGAGFGGPGHVDLAVRSLERAGAAGLHMDDQPYPKSASYHRSEGGIVAPDVMAARLRTALAARRNPDFAIVARTDALRVTKSIEQTVARCRDYVEAGADALMILDLAPAQADHFRATFPETPLVWIGGVAPPIPSLAELTEAGFVLACYPFSGVAAVSNALGDLWAGLKQKGTTGQDAEALERARAETLALVDMAHFWAVEDEFGSA